MNCLKIPIDNASLVSRFWSRVDKNGDKPDQSNAHYNGLSRCWNWAGAKNQRGYGVMKIVKRRIYAHRASFAIANGEAPSELCIMHKCDNPACVNPDHLMAGSIEDNNRDAARKGRVRCGNGAFKKGEAHARRKLSDLDVAEIRTLRAKGERLYRIAETFNISPQYASCLCAFKYRN